MGKWNVGMEGEQDAPPLLAEGWQRFTIAGVKLVSEEESKSGNAYFLWDMACDEGTISMRTTLIKGKRWLLKQTLSACGIEAKDDDPEKKYIFGPEDVEGKTVMGNVKNKIGEPFTGQNGALIEPKPKSEICGVKKDDEILSEPKPELPKTKSKAKQAPATQVSTVEDDPEIPF